jgi:hypothetical protein
MTSRRYLMRLCVFLCAWPLLSLTATAQTGVECPAPARDYWKPDGTFGDLAFYVPAGWQESQEQGVIVLTPSKLLPRQLTRIVLLPPQTLTGDPGQLFEAVWAGWRSQLHLTDNNRPDLSRTPKGVQIMNRYSRVYSPSYGNGTLTLQIAIIGNRAQPYFYLAFPGNFAYDNDFQMFKNTLELAAPAQRNLPEPGVPCGLHGVYVGLRIPSAIVVRADPQVEALVFFPDGNVIRHLPEKGLEAFDFATEVRQSRNSCGRYRVIGNHFRITWADGSRRDGDREGANLNIDGLPYTPAPDPSGLKLDGTYRGDRAPTDARIRFTPDGRFIENGILEAINYRGGDKSPGSGTYGIHDYTVDLRYADGRVVPLSFYILASEQPGSHPRLIHLNSRDFLLAQ